MTGSFFHSGWLAHILVEPTEKPSCEAYQGSKTSFVWIQRRNSVAGFWFFE
jgi:hypothetical protein